MTSNISALALVAKHKRRHDAGQDHGVREKRQRASSTTSNSKGQTHVAISAQAICNPRSHWIGLDEEQDDGEGCGDESHVRQPVNVQLVPPYIATATTSRDQQDCSCSPWAARSPLLPPLTSPALVQHQQCIRGGLATGKRTDLFCTLPAEIVVHILQLVPRLGKTRLHVFCVSRRWCELAKWAFDPSSDGNAAIQWAAEHGRIAAVRELLNDARVDPSAANDRAVRGAAENGHLEVVKLLLKDWRVDPAALDNAALRFASYHGHVKVVKKLLRDSRVNPADMHNYAVRMACAKGHIKIVRRLLEDPRTDPSVMHNFIISLVSKYGRLEIVRTLLRDPRVNPAMQNSKALRLACAEGHVEVVRELLKDKRVDPTALDPDLDISEAVVLAAQRGHLEVVEELLRDSRVDPSARDNEALAKAHEGGHVDVVRALLRHPAVAASVGQAVEPPPVVPAHHSVVLS